MEAKVKDEGTQARAAKRKAFRLFENAETAEQRLAAAVALIESGSFKIQRRHPSGQSSDWSPHKCGGHGAWQDLCKGVIDGKISNWRCVCGSLARMASSALRPGEAPSSAFIIVVDNTMGSIPKKRQDEVAVKLEEWIFPNDPRKNEVMLLHQLTAPKCADQPDSLVGDVGPMVHAN